MPTRSVKKIFLGAAEGPSRGYWSLGVILTVAPLLIYKTTSSIGVLASAWSSHTIRARPQVVSLNQLSHIGVLERSLNYFAAIWPALLF